MSNALFLKIKEALDQNKIEYKILEHEPVGKSKEVSLLREKLTGKPATELIKQAVKSMLIRNKEKFYLFNLSAAKQLNLKKIRNILNTNRLALATPEEINKITDCIPGEIPPFGNLFNVPVYADTSITNEEICFNAGLLTKTIFMKRKDWEKIVKPITAEFTD